MKLYLMWMDTRETVPLTNSKETPAGVSWSNDDRYLAFTMFVPQKNESLIQMPEQPEGAEWNSPPTYIDKMNYRGDGAGYFKGGNMQLFTLSAKGGTPRQITSTEFDHGTPTWSKNNDLLYFAANFHTDEEHEPLDS